MTMEFRYKLNPMKISMYGLMPLGILALIIVYNVVIYQFDIVHVVGDLIFPFAPMAFIGMTYYMFYRSANNIVLRLDDYGVSHESNGNIITIAWYDVTTVSCGKTTKDTVIEGIVIKSEHNQITIGKDIEGFPQIIQTTKQMVGDRFITYDIPWELKNPKSK